MVQYNVLLFPAPKNACGTNPCQNGGTCNVDASAQNGHTCTCPNTHKGTSCESKSMFDSMST